ncbi:hypothetical protein PUN28_001897 [Cardiocondyla obscurior]|uniref:Uncharacterized protein n=1 Tax=Cardiocondyla obscurior TaxID=286306 RepID=A0AAW2GRN1_9HYME
MRKVTRQPDGQPIETRPGFFLCKVGQKSLKRIRSDFTTKIEPRNLNSSCHSCFDLYSETVFVNINKKRNKKIHNSQFMVVTFPSLATVFWKTVKRRSQALQSLHAKLTQRSRFRFNKLALLASRNVKLRTGRNQIPRPRLHVRCRFARAGDEKLYVVEKKKRQRLGISRVVVTRAVDCVAAIFLRPAYTSDRVSDITRPYVSCVIRCYGGQAIRKEIVPCRNLEIFSFR